MVKSVKSSKENLIVKIFRIILGLVFIFSSTMKGIDPMGTAYRVEDYLEVYNLLWLYNQAFSLGVLLIAVEFLLGISLLLKIHIRLAALGTLLIMIIFTLITFFDAKYDLVPDCGCFGDAIKLTAWQTFFKNIVLILLALVVFIKKNSIKTKIPLWLQSSLLLVFMAGYFYFIFYNYNHLPVIDFMDWKKGRDMKAEGSGEVKSFVIYKNKITGEQKEYLSSNYPWNDSVWMSEWEFVDQRMDESGFVRKHNVIVEDYDGNNVTRELIENPEYQLLLVSYDVEKADGEGMIKASKLSEMAVQQSISFALISSSGEDIIETYRQVYQINYPSYLADDTELKAMIRSNPGMLLLKNGIVINKWHFHDFPGSLENLLNEK